MEPREETGKSTEQAPPSVPGVQTMASTGGALVLLSPLCVVFILSPQQTCKGAPVSMLQMRKGYRG